MHLEQSTVTVSAVFRYCVYEGCVNSKRSNRQGRYLRDLSDDENISRLGVHEKHSVCNVLNRARLVAGWPTVP